MGFRFCFSRLLSTKRSMLVLDHLGSFTAGNAGAETGRKDQNCLRSGAITYFPVVGTATDTVAFGHAAPALIHAVRSAISASLSFPPRGIFSSGSVCRTAVISRLLSGSPGLIAGPREPPFSIASALSRRRSPSCEVVWQ